MNTKEKEKSEIDALIKTVARIACLGTALFCIGYFLLGFSKYELTETSDFVLFYASCALPVLFLIMLEILWNRRVPLSIVDIEENRICWIILWGSFVVTFLVISLLAWIEMPYSIAGHVLMSCLSFIFILPIIWGEKYYYQEKKLFI